MNEGCVEIFCGNGQGKTSMALGKSIRACSRGNSVVIIQFLKGRETEELNYLNNMNLDIKLFRFEKSDRFYEELDEQGQAEQRENIINGLNFARKLLTTCECDLLVLDEVLGVLDHGIVRPEDLVQLMVRGREEGMHMILTGRSMYQELQPYVDLVTTVETEEHR